MDIRACLTIIEAALNELSPSKTPEIKQAVGMLAPLKDKIGVNGRKMVLSQFLAHIEDQGFTPIQHGVFGAVFTRPGLDYVIKIFRNDPAYLTFVKYALSHSDNPMLPRFRGKFMKIDKDYDGDRDASQDNYIVRMERLLPLSGEDDYATIQLLGYAASRKWDSTKTFYSRTYAAILNGKLSGIDTDKDYLVSILRAIVKNETILPTIFSLYDLASKHGFPLDVSIDNFMKRQDGTLVFTDPFCDPGIVDP